jgi:hypothetical protein
MTTNYTCGDCGDIRNEENIDMKKYSKKNLGKFPICSDKSCSIENVEDPTDNTSEFEITEDLS